MTPEELLEKLTRLDSIYSTIYCEIDIFGVNVNDDIYQIWKNRKEKIQLNLINKFKKEVLTDFLDKVAPCTEYINGKQYRFEYKDKVIPVIEYSELEKLSKK